MHTEVAQVTPAQAEEWLKTNSFNRRLSPHTVSRYAADMANGEWRLNHQGIAFDEKGVLVDGQHRLQAIVKSGITIKMMVTRGSDRVGVDELRVRHAAEVIKFGGLSDWIEKHQIEVAKQMLYLCSESKTSHVFSTSQLVSFADKNKAAILFSCGLFKSHQRGVSCAASRAVIATAYYYCPHDELSEFVETLYSGIPQSLDKSAAIKCRDMMIAGGFSGGMSNRRAAAYKMMRAIKAFCDRQPIKSLMTQGSPAFLVPKDRT